MAHKILVTALSPKVSLFLWAWTWDFRLGLGLVNYSETNGNSIALEDYVLDYSFIFSASLSDSIEDGEDILS